MISDERRDTPEDARVLPVEQSIPEREGPDRDPRLERRLSKRGVEERYVSVRRQRQAVRVRALARSDAGVATLAIAIGGAPAVVGAAALERLVGPTHVPTPVLVAGAAAAVLTIAGLRSWARWRNSAA